jgi:hypothetical protein
MSQPKDINEREPESGKEFMLVDLLYGELDQTGEGQVTPEAAGDDELEALRELRGLFRELPEEEPPAAITAKLLHAASLHASSASGDEEKRGLWAWLMSLVQPIAMYPGLAAATTLVLVAGVAGSFYLSGRTQLAEPTVTGEPASSKASPDMDMPEGAAPARTPAGRTWETTSAANPGGFGER